MDKIPRISDALTPFFFFVLRRIEGDFFFFFLLIAEIIAHLESELNEAQCKEKFPVLHGGNKLKKMWSHHKEFDQSVQ